MFIWVPLTAVMLFWVGWFLSRRPTTEIPILINGLIPSEPGAKSKKESGTTVYIVYVDKETDAKEEEIFRGYADEEGRVEAHISSENVGRSVLIRARNAAYTSEEFRMIIPRHGIIHTVRTEKDRAYGGTPRGKDVGNLTEYYSASRSAAEVDRDRYIRAAASIASHAFARIHVSFWLAAYIASILAFAGDYWRFGDSFYTKWESFFHCVYFSTVTITTLGYGETYPMTDQLRIAVSIEAILGIFIVGFALNSLFYGPRR